MYSTVIVPLDGSPFAEYALPLGAILALRMRAELLLIRVHDSLPRLEFHDARWIEFTRAEEEAYLERLAATRLAAAPAAVAWRLLDGPVARAICSCVAACTDPLLVISTHGRTGISRSWLGSVADGVARHSTAPVLFVRPPDDRDASRPLPTPVFANVLVALDGSPIAERILPHASIVAEAVGAPLLLFRAVPIGGVIAGEAYASMRDVAAKYQAQHPRLRVRPEIRFTDAPGSAIISRARSLERPLIALGSNGRGLSRFVLGSVADDVLRGAPQAVLMIRPPLGVSPTNRRGVPSSVSAMAEAR
jgi:nucleotide-binding universal stress UspA family protein